MKEIHFYENMDSIPSYIRYYSSWDETINAIKSGEEIIHTTQMGLLSEYHLVDECRVFIHDGPNDMYEIKLGCDNERTSREIKRGHNLFAMWRYGVFEKEE